MTKILPPGRDGIKMLISVLRNPLPKNFIWDFGTVLMRSEDDPEDFQHEFGKPCGSAGCAMGLAEILYDNLGNDKVDLQDILEMDHDSFNSIFWSDAHYPHRNGWGEVTPFDVADALEEYLENEINEEE